MKPPQHGGDPRHCVYPVGMTEPLLNLATGINPWPWPVPTLPGDCFTQLPYESHSLQDAAAAYYQVKVEQLLLTAGSQPVIQLLPKLCEPGSVLLPAVAYEEHAYRWQLAGHRCTFFSSYERDALAAQMRRQATRYLVLISPNNPDGQQLAVADLAYWLSLLPGDGVLLVDQAYVDCCPELQANSLLVDPRVVLLRSVGKFFGLPGLRLGAVLAGEDKIALLRREIGPWSLCRAAQYLGPQLYADRQWQSAMRAHLARASAAQSRVIVDYLGHYADAVYRQPLFTTLRMPLPTADSLASQALAQGLLCRVYRCGEQAYMRWGLAADIELLRSRLDTAAVADGG